MLRDLVISSMVLFLLWQTIRFPFSGILAWTWLTIMQPHKEVYGFFSQTMRINFTVAFLTILVWFFSKDRKFPPLDFTITTILLFLGWMTISCFLAPYPDESWELWDTTWKTIALGVLIWATANSKMRIHALIWVMALSLLFFGAKGGILSIMQGGAYRVKGPDGTILADNNQLALALLMIMPLANYLRLHSANRTVRIGLIVVMCLTFMSILTSYSRGAYVALVALAIFGWLRSKNKFVYPIVIGLLAYPAINFMPQAFYDRINSLNSLDEDGSFQGRIAAWKVAYSYAVDHFPFGASFAGLQHPQIFFQYSDPALGSHAAHSIYFQVLGEHGFIGLFLFLIILSTAFVNTQKIRWAARNTPELAWARDLATMIQVGLLVWCVGGAALSMAYYDLPLIWIMLLPALHKLVLQSKTQPQNALQQGNRALAPASARPAFPMPPGRRPLGAGT